MDITQFLEENKIRYWEKGKNISQGYIGLQCPFCDDTSNHLGIRLDNLKVTCWKCGNHSLPKLIKALTNLNYIDAKAISKNLDGIVLPDRIPAEKLIYPLYFSEDFPLLHRRYLISRNFTPRELIRKYNLRACYRLGKYKYRIIIPIYRNSQLVSWTSRDVSGVAEEKYKAATIEESLINPHDLIFNFDSVKQGQDAFCVEGPFDVFRIGDGAFCFLGIKVNAARLRQIALKQIRRFIIFFDSDLPGRQAAKYVANTVAPLVKEVLIVKYKFNTEKLDPAQISPEQATKLKIDLDFNQPVI